jgi:hypothetical protein
MKENFFKLKIICVIYIKVVKSFEAEARVHIPPYSTIFHHIPFSVRHTVFFTAKIFLELCCAIKA